MGHWERQSRKGLVGLAALATIARGETYGYRIVQQLQGLDGLQFTERTVYPVLTQLARWTPERAHRALASRGAAAVLSPDGSLRPAISPDGGELGDGVLILFKIAQLNGQGHSQEGARR